MCLDYEMCLYVYSKDPDSKYHHILPVERNVTAQSCRAHCITGLNKNILKNKI